MSVKGSFRFISDAGSQRAIAILEDIRSCDVANAKDQKEECVKLDRKLSFSSVLNRNSESYKQSRFRRASSFSFMPKDSCSMATNDKVLEFESNLKIRHRPRPKSLNLSHPQGNEAHCPLDSTQCEHSPESRIEPQGRKTRLDSIVEMAAAWLEESKSVMQSQCGMAQNFNSVGEDEHARSRRPSVNTDLGLEMMLASHGREKSSETTTEHLFANSKNARQGATDRSYCIRDHEESDTKSDETARPQNTGISEVSSDRIIPSFAKDLEPCVIPDECTDDGSYLQDIRELLKGMMRKHSLQEEGKDVLNSDCSTKSFFPRQNLRKCEDDVDETPRAKSSQNCFAAYDSPFLDDRKDRVEASLDHCDGFRIDAGEGCEKGNTDAEESNTDTTSGRGKPLIVEESSAIDSSVNEQQEIHLKTNSTDSFPGWNTSDKQTLTQTSIRLSQYEVHRDAMTNINYRVAEDQISRNELKIGEEKTCDSFLATCIDRSVRPRSCISKVDVNGTTMELLHLPPMRKKRSRSASNLGPHKYEGDKYADVRKVLPFFFQF